MEKEQENKKVKNKKSKIRMVLVLTFIAIFALISFISLKGSYLEYKELGENYIDIFWTNIKIKYYVMGINFVILFGVIYFTNNGIKKGLKVFFDQEKKEMPKLPNKSIALVASAIISVIVATIATPNIILAFSNATFGSASADPIFGLDASYFMFVKPVIQMVINYLILIIIGLSAYSALYYIIIFNMYFDGIDRKTLKGSLLMKKLMRNIIIVAILIAGSTLVNTQNIVLDKFLTLENDTELTGAGFTESTVKLWGYRIFALVIVVCTIQAVRYFKKSESKHVLRWVAIIPGYLVCLFVVMVGFDLIFVNSNELDKEKQYITYNIEKTKQAYNIDISEDNLEYTGTVTENEINENNNIIDNITIVSQDMVLKTLEDSQTEAGYYTYRNASIGNYKINGKNSLVYLSPREIISGGTTYNNKTYEFTHGNSEIITSATSTTESGNVQYVQKNITGTDEQINISEPRIYFGTETNNTIITNAKNKQEYDYTDEKGKEYTYSYDGDAGISLNFLDRLILGIRKGDLNLAFSSSVTSDSKILINRNVIERAKKALPYLMYDEDPYTVVDDNGNIIWVLDAYTVSSNYPYSTYTTIEYNNSKQKINYIRNSVKVLINSYDGTMKFYITDRTDPIAMAYRNTYTTLFEDIDEEIPESISNNFVYPEFLYNIQAEMIKTYHNVKPDVLYRNNDIWDLATFNTTQTTKTAGSDLQPYYTMVKTSDTDEKIGLVQVFTPENKQNIISYLVGTYDGSNTKLKLYKFSSDSNILGPMQLDKQIEQDETISAELSTISVTGSKLTKQMIVVPINNTLLYVEPIYQTMLNESDVPVLKKIIVASGNKVAIGDNLQKALTNLLSQYAVDIQVDNTDDIDGLIDAIVKANNNLTESNNNNDWEMMGEDIQKLQELITSLQTMKQEADKNKEENNVVTNTTDTESMDNTVNEM